MAINAREVVFGTKPKPGKNPKELEPKEIKKLILLLIAGSILCYSFQRNETRNDMVIEARCVLEHNFCFNSLVAWVPSNQILIDEDTVSGGMDA